MCRPHDCQALPFKSIMFQEVKEEGGFLYLLAGMRRVCGIVTEFISVLRADTGILASLKPSEQRLRQRGFRMPT